MQEIWKPIDGYENLYEVSNLGNVKTLYNFKDSLLALQDDGRGYLQVTLCNENGKNKVRVHRLVAEAFLPNPNNLPVVSHEDDNKKNNTVSNLLWCSIAYNNQKENSKAIEQLTIYGDVLKQFPSIHSVTKDGFRANHVSQCCSGKRKTHGGFKWRYLNEEAVQ